MGTDVASTTELPGGYLLVDRGTVLDLLTPASDLTAVASGRLVGFAVQHEDRWALRTRLAGRAQMLPDRDAAVAELTRYAADLLGEKP